MQTTIALLCGISVAAIAVVLHVRKNVDKTVLTIMFGLAIVGGLAIANYDVLTKWKGLGIEMETARGEIQVEKESALKEIKKEVGRHKDSIAVLMKSANDLTKQLEKQKEVAEALVEKATELESEIDNDQKQLAKIKTDVIKAKQATQASYNATEELAKIITRIAYFQVATKNQFGTAKAKKAIQKITADLNRITVMMIPDREERGRFVRGLQNELSEE